MTRFDARYVIWGVSLLLIFILPLFAGFAGFGWELAQCSGLIGAVGCIALCGSPIRPRQSTPPVLLTLRQHSLIADLVLGAVILHVGGLLLVDRTVFEYLKPTAPIYQLAGIGATVLLVGLMVISSARMRRSLWDSHRTFQAIHVVVGCLIMVLAAIHVVATARYAGGYERRLLFVGVTMGALLMLTRRRQRSTRVASERMPHWGFVFGRHSAWVISSLATLLLCLAIPWFGRAMVAMREPVLARQESLALWFPHTNHVAVNCLVCHHNYADGRGMESCVGCHRGGRKDIIEGVQARFHGFCFDCHRHPAANLRGHGPVSGCNTCHQVNGSQ